MLLVAGAHTHFSWALSPIIFKLKRLLSIQILAFLPLALFSQTLEVAKSIPSQVSFDELTQTIKSNFTRPGSIAKCAYYWIAGNIEYDYQTSQNRALNLDTFWTKNSYEQVLLTGKAVCAGYSGLFEGILTECGVEVKTINGTSRQGRDFIGGYNLQEDHAWNAYLSGDKWNLVDVTWASTTIENDQILSFYFQTDPRVFILSHFPSNSEWQLLETPITYFYFLNSVYLNYRFFEVELGKLPPHFNHKANQIQLSFDFHEYWKPKVYKRSDSTFLEMKQELVSDTINQKSILTFLAEPADIIKIEANWIIFDSVAVVNYPEVGYLKIPEKEITGAKNP